MTDPKRAVEMEAMLTAGGLTFKNNRETLANLTEYFGADAQVFVSVWEWAKTRSVASNRYYFGVIVRRIAEQQKMSVDDVHEGLKMRLLRKPLVYVDPKTGEIIDEVEVGGQTHRMTQKQFNEYVRAAELFAMEFFGLDFTSQERETFYAGLSEAA